MKKAITLLLAILFIGMMGYSYTERGSPEVDQTETISSVAFAEIEASDVKEAIYQAPCEQVSQNTQVVQNDMEDSGIRPAVDFLNPEPDGEILYVNNSIPATDNIQKDEGYIYPKLE